MRMGSCSILFLLLLFIFLASALHDGGAATQLLLPLTHSLPHSGTPTHHLLRSSAARSSARHRSRRNNHNQQQQTVSLPLSSGSDYTLSLSLGHSAAVDIYMDTGSDLVWFPCSPFTCILCDGKPKPASPPPPPPKNSTLVPCADPSCSAAHSSLPSSDLCAISNCPLEDIETSSCKKSHHCPQFYYAYGDGSLLGVLRRGPLGLSLGGGGGGSSSSSSLLPLPNFTFACAHSALAEPLGVAGFGPGPLSLPSQLSSRRFSYCLVSHPLQSNNKTLLLKPSPLILGRRSSSAADEAQFVYTPIIANPKHPYFYSVGLLAVSVGPVRIPAGRRVTTVNPAGDGGMVVDSGTTFTMLPTALYNKIVSEFGTQMGRAGFKRAEEAEAETGLKPCYRYLGRREDARAVPALGLHFAGNAILALPRRNYFMGFSGGDERVGCLMVMDGGDGSEGGPAGTLGNFQQQGLEVVYDLEAARVGFARRRCASLWDVDNKSRG